MRVAVALLVAQVLLSAVGSFTAAQRAGQIREQGQNPVETTPLSARASLDGEDLGWTPVAIARRGTLRLARPGWSLTVELTDPGVQLRNPLALQPEIPLVSQALAWPLAALGLILGVAAALPRRVGQEPEEFIGPGGRVGRYLLERPVGRGAMAEVFEGRSLDRPGRLAIKVLHAEVSEQEEFRKRFEREAAICRSLDHPGILKVHDAGEARGRLYLVMDFVPGPTLRERIPAEGMDAARVRELAEPLAEALAHAHEHEIVHRDLKPENILMAEDGRPLIADFGLARGARYETLTATDTTLGTPAYMPPEQVTGERSGGKADQYSLGCILYELLSGHPPFTGEPVAVIMQHMTDEPAPPAGAPEPLRSIVMRLLNKAPEARYPDLRQVLLQLRQG